MDAESIRELFEAVGPVSIRRMFGGKGIYAEGVIIAIELRDELMLKGDEIIGPRYEEAGSRRWSYTNPKSGKIVSMPYWTIPEEAFDDPDIAADWVRLALQAGLRAADSKG